MGLLDRMRAKASAPIVEEARARQESEAARLIESGNVEEDAGRLAEALLRYDEAIQAAPSSARAYLNRGNALLATGDQTGAIAAYTLALERDPTYAAAHFNLGRAILQSGRPQEAIPSLESAIALRPDFFDAHVALGNALADTDQFEAAIDAYGEALSRNPAIAEVHSNLGAALRRADRMTEAVVSLRRAIEINPGYADAHVNLGNALESMGLLQEAKLSFRQAIALRPDYPEAQSALLFCLSQDASTDPASLFREHCAFGDQYEKPLRQHWSVHGNSRDPDRTLRIGVVSADLRYHAVARFLDPLLIHLRRSASLCMFAYFSHPVEDEMSRRMRPHFHKWTGVAGLADDELARLVRADGIDILVDLSGHTAGHRLLTFARKPAPVQVSWIGYPGTTGLKAMDYYLADRHFLPMEEFGEHFLERLVHLPAVATFMPEVNAPPVNPLPALGNGFFTFGSFNRLSKISPRVIAHWSQLLRALPDSKMVLGAMPLDGKCDKLLQWFAAEGVGPERLELHSRSDTTTYLALHHRVDVCLDTFPYTGGTTTAHALWMGVPTLTLAGTTPAGRHGATILGHVGLDSFVARDAAEFMCKGLACTAEPGELARLRAELRQRFGQSIPAHPELVARGIELAFRIIWKRWCAGLPPIPIKVDMPAGDSADLRR